MNMKNLSCPRCESKGVSLAAMHYKETIPWHKEGNTSGLFGRRYKEEGKISSKRASTFSEPELETSSGINFIFLTIFMIFGFFVVYSWLVDFIPTDYSQDLFFIPESVFKKTFQSPIFLVIFFIIFSAVILYRAFSIAKNIDMESEKYTKEIYPKYLKKYNQLQYCENCHTLYDEDNNFTDANESGFNKLMEKSQSNAGD